MIVFVFQIFYFSKTLGGFSVIQPEVTSGLAVLLVSIQ